MPALLTPALQETTIPANTVTPNPSPTSRATRQPLWTFQTGGAVWSSPTVADNIVYFGSDDQFLYAVTIQGGKLRWKFASNGLVRSRPAVQAGNIYFTSDDGFLYALEASTGEFKWKLDIGNAVIARLLPGNDFGWDYLQSSPTLSDGVVYCGSADGNLYAVDAASGKERWRFQTGDRVRSSPTVVDGTVFVGSWDGFVYALSAQNGQEKWRFDAHGQWKPVQPSPRVADGIVYIGGRSYQMFGLDAETGKMIWSFLYQQGWVESSPALADGVIYVGSSEDRRLYALDGKTGKLVWYFSTDGAVFSSPVVADGMVYFGSAHWTEGLGNCFYAVEIQSGRAQKALDFMDAKWCTEIGLSIDKSPVPIHGVVSSPTISADVIYFGGLDGKLYAVSAAP